MSFVSNILLTVMLYTTLKPNGKFCGNFVWLDMGLTNLLKELNALNASVLLKSHLCCLAIFIYFVLNSAQSSGKM